MNYQSIRAKLEAPLLAAYNSEVPAVPVYFDNVSVVPPDPSKEYVRVNITFGLTTEATLTGSLDFIRGALIIRCFAPKNAGPARCQKMAQLAKKVIDALNSTNIESGSTNIRLGGVVGLSPRVPDNFPHFVSRVDAAWQAIITGLGALDGFAVQTENSINFSLESAGNVLLELAPVGNS